MLLFLNQISYLMSFLGQNLVSLSSYIYWLVNKVCLPMPLEREGYGSVKKIFQNITLCKVASSSSSSLCALVFASTTKIF